MVMGKVLSQGEIDNLLTNLLEDASVLPSLFESAVEQNQVDVEPVPAGIAAFKAKIAAMQSANEPAAD